MPNGLPDDVRVRDILAGDTFVSSDGTPIWTAISDAREHHTGRTLIDVRFCADGGAATRVWDDGAAAHLTVTRARPI